LIDQCSAKLLPRLDQMPPRHPAPCRDLWEEQQYWQETKLTLKMELEAVEADQFLSPLSRQERETIRGVYLNAINRCQQKIDRCFI